MRAGLVLLVAVSLVVARSATAAHVGGSCDGGIPSDETLGFRSFPRGDVFCPLLADPKAGTTFLSYLRGVSSSALGTDVGSIGVGDQLGLFRWNGPEVGQGMQVSISGSVFAQFDLETSSFDLINADYLVGLPLTLKIGAFGSRLRLYHQSSHLGDEFVLRAPNARENLSFEAVDALLSIELGALRAYGGGDYLFERRPATLGKGVAHGGLEVRQPGSIWGASGRNQVRLVAALDVKSVEEREWSVGWSARAGFEVGRTPGAEHLSRPWRLLAEFYDGPAPYGQFFHQDVSSIGVGIHLGP